MYFLLLLGIFLAIFSRHFLLQFLELFVSVMEGGYHAELVVLDPGLILCPRPHKIHDFVSDSLTSALAAIKSVKQVNHRLLADYH